MKNINRDRSASLNKQGSKVDDQGQDENNKTKTTIKGSDADQKDDQE